MIKIKDLIFKLLDEIEPNELIDVGLSKQYSRSVVCRTDSVFPLATSISRRRFLIDPDTILGMESVVPPQQTTMILKRQSYADQYKKEHTIEYNDEEYIIEEEILDIQYEEDYFSITKHNIDGVYKEYFKYEDINYVRKIVEHGEDVLIYYNKMQYQLYK